MADDEFEDIDEEGDDEDFDEDDEEGEGGPSRKGGGKKLIIIIALALLLVVGGVAAAYFTGLLEPVMEMIGGGEPEPAEGEETLVQGDAVFYELPELLVNLSTPGRKTTFLKIKVSLQLQSEQDIPRIELMMPRIVDNFQVYLRELRVEDLKGSAGMYRLREELLARVSVAVAPAVINDVLFKEMLVQ